MLPTVSLLDTGLTDDTPARLLGWRRKVKLARVLLLSLRDQNT
jgi:hypothetical protein